MAALRYLAAGTAAAAGAYYAPAVWSVYQAESALTTAEKAIDALGAKMKTCDDAIAAARASARRAARDASAARVDVEAAAKDVAAARAALAEAQAVVDDRLAAERRFALRVASLEAEAKRADAIVEAKTREKETSAAEEVRARLAMDAAPRASGRGVRRRRVPAPRPGRRARSAAPMRPDGLASGVFEVRERGQTLEERG